MGDTSAGKLFIELGADISDFISGMKTADRAFQDMTRGVEEAKKALDVLGAGTGDSLNKTTIDAKNTGKALEEVGEGAKDAGKAADGMAEGLKHAEQAATGAHGAFAQMLAAEVAVRVLEAAFEGLKDAVGDAVRHLGEVEVLNAQTAAAIKSTGAAAGVSSQQIQDMANAIEKNTGVEGEAVQRGANLLLTFTNIRDVAGKNNDVFSQTTKIMADMSVAMGQDMKSSALQLGKALNDPEKGMSALQRVGVAFTESQKETVKQLQETGHTLEAQKIILKELQTEFGGSAEAYGKTLPGAIEKAKAAWENMTDAILGPNLALMKAGMTEVADVVNAVADAIQEKGIGGAINDAFGPDAKAIVIGLAAAFTVALWPAVAEAGVAFAAAAMAAAPIIATAAAVAFAARPIMEIWGTLPEVFSYIFKAAETTLTQWYQTAHDVADSVWKAFSAAAKNIGAAFSNVFGGLGTFIADQYSKLPDAVKAPLAGLVGSFKGFVADVGGAVATIPGMVAGHVAAVGAIGPKLLAGVGSAIGKEFSEAYQIGSTYMGNLQKYIATFGAEATKGLGHVAKAATDMGHDMGKGGKEAADAAEKAAKAIENTFGKMEADLASIRLDQILDPTIDGLKIMEQEAAVMKGALKKLMQEGVDPASAGFVALKNNLRELNADIADGKALEMLAKEYDPVIKAIDAYQAKGVEITAMQDAMGDSYDALGANLNRTKALFDAYIKGGVDPTSEAVQACTRTMADYQQQLDMQPKKHKDAMVAAAGLTNALEDIDNRATLLGATYDDHKDRMSALQKGIMDLADAEGTSAETMDLARQAIWDASDASERYTSATGQTTAVVKGLHDSMATMADVFGVKFDEPVTSATLKALEFGDGLTKLVVSAQNAPAALGLLGDTFMTNVLPSLITGAEFIGSTMVPALEAMGVAAWTALGPWGQIALAIGGVLVAGGLLIQNWDKIKVALLAAWTAIADGATSVFGAMGNFISGIFNGIGDTIKGAINAAITAVNFLIQGMDRIHFESPSWVPGIGGRSWGISIPEIPYLAQGAIATGPTVAMIGEAGPEAVVPLNDASYNRIAGGVASQMAGQGGAVTVNVNYTGSGKWTRRDAEDLGDLLVGTLRQRLGVRQ